MQLRLGARRGGVEILWKSKLVVQGRKLNRLQGLPCFPS